MFLLNSLRHWRAPLKKLGLLGSFSTSKLMKIYELLRRFSEFDQILYLICSQSTCASKGCKSTDRPHTGFLRFLGASWQPPRVQTESEMPFIPFESEADALVWGAEGRLV